jgi:hypothetical protein
MLQLLTREAFLVRDNSGRSRRERPILSMTWTLDPQTGKPVGRWVVEAAEPASLPLSSAA